MNEDKYRKLKASEIVTTMRACYEDAVRMRGFDPLTDPDLAILHEAMRLQQLNPVQAAMAIIEHAGGSNDKKTAQATFRGVLAAAFYMMVVAPATQLTEQP